MSPKIIAHDMLSLKETKVMWQLLNVFSAEQQAIAIYEAQVFWRRGPSSEIFRDVLAEERSHRLSIETFMGLNKGLKWVVFLMTPFNMMMGWVFGSMLSVFPRKLCYRVHVWAEEEAAKTYEETAKKIPRDAPSGLQEALVHAARQEHQHARRFEVLLKDLNFK
jgi:rubrerythrin